MSRGGTEVVQVNDDWVEKGREFSESMKRGRESFLSSLKRNFNTKKHCRDWAHLRCLAEMRLVVIGAHPLSHGFTLLVKRLPTHSCQILSKITF